MTWTWTPSFRPGGGSGSRDLGKTSCAPKEGTGTRRGVFDVKRSSRYAALGEEVAHDAAEEGSF